MGPLDETTACKVVPDFVDWIPGHRLPIPPGRLTRFRQRISQSNWPIELFTIGVTVDSLLTRSLFSDKIVEFSAHVEEQELILH